MSCPFLYSEHTIKIEQDFLHIQYSWNIEQWYYQGTKQQKQLAQKQESIVTTPDVDHELITEIDEEVK